MSEINKADFTPDAPNFKTLVRMSFQGLTNFPYIEEDFDSLTNYGFLSKVVEYLNEVISNNNEQNDLMTGLYNAYTELQDYVNNYFGDLDVQEEINKKLDKMAADGTLIDLIETYIDPYIEEQNLRINSIQNQVNSLASGSPLVASSTSEMTDTDRVYVNTTDGKWYYYDGDSWEIGGTYQSTGIGEETINIEDLDLSILFNHYNKTTLSDFGYGGFSASVNDYPYIDETITNRCNVKLTIGDNNINYLYVKPNTNLDLSIIEYPRRSTGSAKVKTVAATNYTKIDNGYLLNYVHDDMANAFEMFFIFKKPDGTNITEDELASYELDVYYDYKTNELDSLLTHSNKTLTGNFEFGAAATTNGNLVENTIRMRSKQINFNEKNGKRIIHFTNIPTNSYIQRNLICYKDSKFVKTITTGFTLMGNYLIFTKDSTFNSIRVVLQKNDGSDFTSNEVNLMKYIKYKEFDNNLEDKEWAGLGDSITHGFIPRNYTGYPGVLKSYLMLACSKLGITPKNYGIDGSTVANVADRSPMSRRYNNMTDDADIISVMGGTNDVRNGVSLGTINDSTDSTFYGALKIIAQGLYDKYYINQGTTKGQEKTIFFITPLKLLETSSGVIGGTGENYDLSQWIKAIKDVAEMYSFPVLDLYNLSLLNPAISQTVQGTETGYTGTYNPYMTDGTHPTQEGQEIISKIAAGFIESIRK